MKRLLQIVIFVFLYFTSNFLIAQPYPEWEQYISPNGGLWECKLKNNILYCGTYGAGLVEYNLETKETIPYTVYNSGLANNEINDVDVDQDGNIWLGHWGAGISKIHTEGCEIFNTANSGLQNDTVNTICVDQNNKIWIGTLQGIDVIDGENWTHYDNSNSGLIDNKIFTIEVDDENNKWIGSVNSFAIFDNLEWEVHTIETYTDCFYREIAVVDPNIAFISRNSYGSGLLKFQDGMLENLYWPGPLYKYITDMEFDGDENLWISVRNANNFGIAMFNGSEFTEYSLGSLGNDCRTINVDQDNNKWLGIDYQGLFKFDNLSFEKVSDGLFSCKWAQDIAIENDNSVWFAYHENLVEYHAGEWINSNNYKYGFHLTNLQGIDIDSEGYKWIAAAHELIKFNENYWLTFTEMNSPLMATENYIKDILIDNNNNLWVAEKGLLNYNGNWTSFNTANSGIPTNDIFCLGIDSTNLIWMGSDTKLISFDGQTFHIFDTIGNNIYFNDIRSICIDTTNTKWIGTENGLVVYDNTNWVLYDTLNSGLPDNSITEIEIDKTGKLWVGTDNGIGVFNNGDWTVYNTTNSSLLGNHIYDIEVSENNTVWITASGGISRYNKNGFIGVDEYPINQNASVQLNCYPNPFSEFINIELSPGKDIQGEVVIYNNQGKKIRTIEAGRFLSDKNKLSWDGTNEMGKQVKGGIYYCIFLSKELKGSSKLVKY